MKNINFLKVSSTGLLTLFIISTQFLTGCKKYDEGPAFTLLPARVRLANEWQPLFYPSYYMKLTVTGKVKYKNSNGDWYDGGEWEFDENHEILDLGPNGNWYILKLTNKELWIAPVGFEQFVWKYKSTSFL